MAIFQLPNPPDGFEFAKNGLGEQTGTLIKSAASTLNETARKFASSLPKVPPINFTPPADTNGPSLTETMAAIKNGSINKDITAALGKVANVAESLPSGVADSLASAQAAVAAKMQQAQADLPKLMAIAQANMDLTVKTTLASTGKPPTEEQLKQASGALAIFQDGPALLKAQAESISKTVAEAGANFGAKLPAALNTAGNFAKAGLDKVSSLAVTAGASITSFANSVPAQTIPDPANPGQTIPNPAYTTFAADPANASKLSSLSSLTSSMTTAAAGLTSAFGAIEAKATAAVSGGIADLKAFAAAAQFAQPAGGIMASVRSLAVDTSKVSAAQINKVVAQAAASNPAQPPKPADQITEEKIKEPATPSTTAKPKVAVFKKNPDDKISESFLQAYLKAQQGYGSTFNAATEKSIIDSKINSFYPGYADLRDRAKKILADKPDPATHTPEEAYYVEKRRRVKALIESDFLWWKSLERLRDRTNEAGRGYRTFKQCFEQNLTYGDVPLSVESDLLRSTTLSEEEQKLYYSTYADLIKAKPELALPANLEAPFSA